MFESIGILSLTIWVPIVAGLLVLATGGKDGASGGVDGQRTLALLGAALGFAVSLPLWTGFNVSTAAMQFVEHANWIPLFNVHYRLGVDGISMPFVVLNSFVTLLVVLAGWAVIKTKVAQYMAAFLIQSGLINGVFASLDGVLFYVFFEAMLIPLYLIIGIWGGPNRVYAAIKFFLYTLLGSLLMLVAMIYLFFVSGGSFDILVWHKVPLAMGAQMLLFVAFFFAFAVKVPMWPVHTWLPDAHVQAPTAGSVILAGVLLKMGTYGLIRYGMPLFPEAVVEFAPWMAILAVIGIIYGALVSMVQKDVKKLVAYSSVSHLGFCVLGLVALTHTAVEGAIFVMLAHGIATGGLFLAVGVIYERRHTRLISEFGGLTKVVPLFATFFMIIVFTSAGLPGLAGFVGEFLVIVGTSGSQVLFFDEASFLIGDKFGPETMAFVFAALSATGVIFGAVYLLWMFQRVMFGPLKNPKNEHMEDLSGREIAYFVPLILACFVMGFFPEIFMSKMHTSVDAFMARMQPGIEKKVSERFDRQRQAASTINWDKARGAVQLNDKVDPDAIARRAAAAKAAADAQAGQGADDLDPRRRLAEEIRNNPGAVGPGARINLKPGFLNRIKAAKGAQAQDNPPAGAEAQ